MMTEAEFHDSLRSDHAPQNLSTPLLALWHDARGDWERAHDTLQDDNSRESAWVHAYLHRKEGDPGNAGYWYHRANKPEARGPLADEWSTIVAALLSES